MPSNREIESWVPTQTQKEYWESIKLKSKQLTPRRKGEKAGKLDSLQDKENK